MTGREPVAKNAAAHGALVLFPESVDAYGHGAEELVEGTTGMPSPVPYSPLGQMNAELLAAQAAHGHFQLSTRITSARPRNRGPRSFPTSAAVARNGPWALRRVPMRPPLFGTW